MRNSRRRLIVLAALAVSTSLISACQPIASSIATGGPATAGGKAAGPVYHLPVKTMFVSVGSNRFGLFVAIHGLVTQGDPTAGYALSYVPDGTSDDNLDIVFDPPTGLLTSIAAEADSKAGDIANAAAKSVGQVYGVLESGVAGQTRLYSTTRLTYWPTEATTKADADRQVEDLNREINAQLAAVIKIQGCELGNEAVLSEARRKKTCDKSGNVIPGSVPIVHITVDYTPAKALAGAYARDCSIGICTRDESPATFTIETNGLRVSSEPVRLPNGAPPVALPLRRTAFTKVTTEYTLEAGLPAKATYKKGAELLGIASLPGQLIGSFVGGVVDGGTQAANLEKAETDAAARKAAHDKPDGQNENARDAPDDAAFDPTVLLIAYPLPQNPVVDTEQPARDDNDTIPLAGNTKPSAKGSNPAKQADPKTPAAALPAGTKTTKPGGSN